MQINYTADAYASLLQLVNFIETTNTKGAGLRWLDRYEVFLQKTLFNPIQVKICHNLTFKKLNLRCINYNDLNVYDFPSGYAVKSYESFRGRRVASEALYGGHFTSVHHGADACNNPNGVWGAINWDLNHSSGVASARIYGIWSSGGINQNIEGFNSWTFQQTFP